MVDNQSVSSLLQVLKLPQNADFFMVKRAYKKHLIEYGDFSLLETYQNLRKVSHKLHSNIDCIWDCKTKVFLSLESLPIWPEDMVFSKSFNDSILLAFFHDVGAAWNAQNINAVKILSQRYKSLPSRGLFAERRFYIPPCYLKNMHWKALVPLIYFTIQNKSLEAITRKCFTKRLNVGLSDLYATINGKYKWVNDKKILKTSSEKIYTSYAK